MKIEEYCKHDALALAARIRQGEVSPREVVEAAIGAAERVNPRLNAIVTPLYEEARAACASLPADAPLRGVPFLLKDLGAPLAGHPFTMGSRATAHYIPERDGELVRRHRAAGLVFLGKTNTSELGLMPVTEPELFGATENPWAMGRTAGGSSGGSAAAVAAGIVPVAHASDGGGSIRIPASCCGLFGLKPTRARNPCGPGRSDGWFGYSIDHVVSRTVRDSAAFLDATAGPEPGAPYAAPTPERPFLEEVSRPPRRLRVAFTTTPFLPSEPERAPLEAAERAAHLCEELGHEVVEAAPAIDAHRFALDFARLIAVATATTLDELGELVGRSLRREDVELSTWMTAALGRELAAVEVEAARRRVAGLGQVLAELLTDCDVLLTPTLAQPPLPHGALRLPPALMAVEELIAGAHLTPVLRIGAVVERVTNRLYQFLPWTPLANVTGAPSMSLPLGMTPEGLPLGVMFTGRFGDEATLLQLAAQLEAAAPWSARRPAVFAG